MVKPEAHLVQISGKMLCTDAMPRADYPSLEQRECGFNRVRVNIPINVNLGYVLYRLVGAATESRFNHSFGIASEFIRHDYVHIGTDVFFDVLRKRAVSYVLSVEEPQIAATLPDTDNNFLVLVANVLTSPAANVGFVHFDSTVQQGLACLFHGRTDAMAKIPSRFIANTDSSFDLVSRHPLTGLTEHKRNHEPLIQGQMGIVKHRASGNRELIIAISTPEQFRAKASELLGLASWAFRAVRPSQPFQQFAAFVVGIKQFRNVRECHSEISN